MLDPYLGGAAVKVVGAKVVVHRAILQHVIDRRQDRRGHGADCLLRPAPGAEPIELGLIVAVLLALGRPGALDEHRLEPRSTLAPARGFALAGTLVLTGAQTGPSDEVTGGEKAAHVAADFPPGWWWRPRCSRRGSSTARRSVPESWPDRRPPPHPAWRPRCRPGGRSAPSLCPRCRIARDGAAAGSGDGRSAGHA